MHMFERAWVVSSAQRIEPKIDVLATVCAVCVVPVIFVEVLVNSPQFRYAATVTNWILWLVFVLDFVVKLAAFGWPWMKRPRGWLSFGIVALSYPGLGDLFATARVARLVRVSRLVRLIRLTRLLVLASRAQTGLKRIVDPSAMPFVTLTVATVVVIGATALYIVESEEGSRLSVSDALWWAAATVTTVGYGDVVPKTGAGRAIGAIVMFVGIAFAGLLTAQIAAYLTRRDQRKLEQDLGGFEAEMRGEIASVQLQLISLHEKLDRLLAPNSGDGD